MKTPIVEFLTPDENNPYNSEDRKSLKERMLNTSKINVQNNASWDLSDIIIATPETLANTLRQRSKYDPENINPAVIIFDECQSFYENQTDQ